jgi:serine protein kinase
VHLDPHVLHAAAVFAILTRLHEPEEKEQELAKKVRIYAKEDVEGVNRNEAERVRQKTPEEGLSGVSPRFVVNALSNAIIQADTKSLTTMDVLLALKDAIDNDARIDPKKKAQMDRLSGSGKEVLL